MYINEILSTETLAFLKKLIILKSYSFRVLRPEVEIISVAYSFALSSVSCPDMTENVEKGVKLQDIHHSTDIV